MIQDWTVTVFNSNGNVVDREIILNSTEERALQLAEVYVANNWFGYDWALNELDGE